MCLRDRLNLGQSCRSPPSLRTTGSDETGWNDRLPEGATIVRHGGRGAPLGRALSARGRHSRDVANDALARSPTEREGRCESHPIHRASWPRPIDGATITLRLRIDLFYWQTGRVGEVRHNWTECSTTLHVLSNSKTASPNNAPGAMVADSARLRSSLALSARGIAVKSSRAG